MRNQKSPIRKSPRKIIKKYKISKQIENHPKLKKEPLKF